MSRKHASVTVRPLVPADMAQVIEMGRRIYPHDAPYTQEHFNAHLSVFPHGQLVAVDDRTGYVVGYAASLIVRWDEYEVTGNWDSFTDGGYFGNHDPVHGRTLYGADIMVHPDIRGRGVGGAIYKARFDLCRQLKLLRIRAGARLRGYGQYHNALTPREYVMLVIRGDLHDPTLSFQLKHGFRVMAVVDHYLHADPESGGYAALIEWINHQVARRPDYAHRPREFGRPRKKRAKHLP